MVTRGRLCPLALVTALAAVLSGSRASGAEAAKLHPALQRIVEVNELAGPDAALDAARSRRLRLVEKEGAVLIAVILEPEAGGGSSIDEAKVRELGCEIDAVSRSYVRVLAKPSALRPLAGHPDVRLVRAPFRAKPLETGLGDFVSESVELTGASAAQELGVTGAGVKVAVVDLGFEELSEAISLGELPADTVTVDLPGLGDNPIEADYKHGVGVAEQVADMAPGARIYCIKIGDEVDLENAADYMAASGIRIGVHSVGWTNASYYDGTGPVSNVLNQSYTTSNIFWAVAAGNEAKNHWRGQWSDPDGDGVLDFKDFDERMSISSSEEVDIFLNWDQYGDPVTDLDLYVYDRNGTVVGLSEEYQAATGEPAEEVSFDYDVLRSPYEIEVVHFSGPTVGLDITIFSFHNELEHAEPRYSLMDPAPAEGAYAVAAINRSVWDEPDPPQEPFSSQGPTTDGRTKPDISAPDGTTSWAYGVLSSYGTSFSAPVVAGAAALLVESDPTLTAQGIRAALTGAAVDVGEAGPDDIYGAGRLSLLTLPPLRTVHYVDRSAAGPVHDGTSWETAFRHPQDALDIASPEEDVWVAAGTYARRTTPTDTVVVTMADGVTVYGGFAGDEATRGARAPEANPTVLEGGGACVHVVVAASDCRLEGFTITGGDAGVAGGGGIFVSGVSNVSVAACVIDSNTASGSGGGLAAVNSARVTVEDCEFKGNSVTAGDGGGAYVETSSVRFERCTFGGNSASGSGGALYAADSGPYVRDCTFTANEAASGGAVCNGTGALTNLANCLLTANRAGRGAAVYNADDSAAALRNCTLSGNAATVEGGAVFNDTLSHTLVTNCILWNDRPEEIAGRCPASKVSYSIIEGGREGLGVVRVTDADPLFVEPGEWDDSGTPGDPSDDVWVSRQETPQGGDYRLQPGSPCIDAAHGDEAEAVDIEGNPRSDDRGTRDTGIGDPTYVDIGAYEFQGRTGSAGGGCHVCRQTDVAGRSASASRRAPFAAVLWLILAVALGRLGPASSRPSQPGLLRRSRPGRSSRGRSLLCQARADRVDGTSHRMDRDHD